MVTIRVMNIKQQLFIWILSLDFGRVNQWVLNDEKKINLPKMDAKPLFDSTISVPLQYVSRCKDFVGLPISSLVSNHTFSGDWVGVSLRCVITANELRILTMRRSESCSTLQLLSKKFLRDIEGLIFPPQGKKTGLLFTHKPILHWLFYKGN